jgi:ribonuclease E
MAIEVMRALMTSSAHPDVREIRVEVHPRVADYLINKKRREITALEETNNVRVHVQMGLNVPPAHLAVSCFNDIGGAVAGVSVPS